MLQTCLEGNQLNGTWNFDDYCFEKTENHRSWLYSLITCLTIASDSRKSRGFQTNNISNCRHA